MNAESAATRKRQPYAQGLSQEPSLAWCSETQAIRESSHDTRIVGEIVRVAAFALLIIFMPPVVVLGQDLWDPAAEAYVKELSNKGETSQVREKAARALGHLSPTTRMVFQALSKVLQDEHEEEGVRLATIDALVDVGREGGDLHEVIVALVNVLESRKAPLRNSSIRAAAARALGKSSEHDLNQAVGNDDAMQALPVLINAVTKPTEDPIVRSNAAWALGQIIGQESTGKEKAEAVKALILAVKLTPVNVGQSAAQSLIRMPQTAVPELQQNLKDNHDPSFRWNITWILGEIGDDAKETVPMLTDLLKGDGVDQNVRGAAAWAIGKVGRLTKAGTTDFPGTVSVLIDALKNVDNDPNVRSNAAWALGRLGPDVKTERARFPVAATDALLEALGDRDHDTRRNAAWALGQIGPDPTTVAPNLTSLLNKTAEADPRVRTEAAVAIGLIGPLGREAQATIQDLADALRDEDPGVRMSAAASLGQLGADARAVIAQLVDLTRKPRDHRVKKEEEGVRRAAADATRKIADALQTQAKTDAIEELQQAAAKLETYEQRQYAAAVKADADKLRTLRWYNRVKGTLEWVQQYQMSIFSIGAYILLWLLLYWNNPLLIFRINEALKPYIGHKLPQFLGGVPVSYLFFGGYFHYRPRVLDAWISENIVSARKHFQEKPTVQQRDVFVELPLFVNSKGISALRASDLRSCFDKKCAFVLICGEGGSGKTSLACQICKWAMMDGEGGRVSKNLMLAILLEQDNFGGTDRTDKFIEVVRTELWHLIASAEPPSTELVERLLESRRILVAVDGFSEMNENVRGIIRPGHAEFPARALVITSRLEETLVGGESSVIKPMRVQGDRLSTFMDAYLVQRNKKDLFCDAEYFACLSKLSRIVGKREITVLLAKLYAEQMIMAKEIPSETLPDNIPDLMLTYLNELNRKVKANRLDDRLVQRDAKAIAWECLKETFRPRPARIEKVIRRLNSEGPPVEQRLRYLEDTLRLVQTIGTGKDQMRFTLDPLAEYLAALQVLADFAEETECWRRFLSALDSAPGSPEATKGFLMALFDCCTANIAGVEVPNFLSAELGRRAVSQGVET